jgi:hypothetical protein
MDSSRPEQNRAPLVGSGEHPDLRCPRTDFADRRRLPSATTPGANRDWVFNLQCKVASLLRRAPGANPHPTLRPIGS